VLLGPRMTRMRVRKKNTWATPSMHLASAKGSPYYACINRTPIFLPLKTVPWQRGSCLLYRALNKYLVLPGTLSIASSWTPKKCLGNVR
jgi:hypothetical protein